MNVFKEHKSNNTPEVEFNFEEGIFKIKGRSIPENAHDFYRKLIDLLIEYFSNPQPVSRLDLFFDYANSISIRYIQEILKLFDNYHKENKTISQVNWYYEEDDESMKELGLFFKSSFQIPFNLIEIY